MCQRLQPISFEAATHVIRGCNPLCQVGDLKTEEDGVAFQIKLMDMQAIYI